MLTRPLSRVVDERGAVAVMVAVMILPLVGLMAFAVETGWWWTHHGHLQTQADAAALAGAAGPWAPGCDDDPTHPNSITGKALQYSGDQNRGAVYNPQYSNSGNVHVLLNSSSYWDQSGSDNSAVGGSPCTSMQPPPTGLGGNTCDPQSVTPTCPNLDVKETESNLPTFFGSIPGFTSLNVHTHARVEIQVAQQESGIRPIAIRDDTAYQSAAVLLYRANSDGSVGALYQTICLPVRTTHDPNQGDSDPTEYTQFTNGSGTSVTMPNPAQSLLERIQLYANTSCTGASEVFPQDVNGNVVNGVNGALDFINVNANDTAGANDPPKVDGVTVLPGTCSPDGYFSSLFAYPADPDPCSATVKAFVSFNPGFVTSGANQNVFVKIDDGNTNASTDATVQGDGSWQASFSIGGESLAHQFTIEWAQTHDKVTGYGNCKMPGNGNPFSNGNPCHDTINVVQQQAFAGTDDSTLATNTGTIDLAQIAEGGTLGANSFVQGTSHTLRFTVRVGGLSNSRPTDPPFILRYAVQSYKRTGVVDCGQGNGNLLVDAILNGCPRPVYLWTGGNCGPPPPNAAPDNTPAGAPIDCVGIVPGNRRGQIRKAFHDRVGTSCDDWMAWKASNGTITGFPQTGDPRVITMIITPPADLSGGGGSTADIPVVKLATFYITGGDGISNPSGSCHWPYSPFYPTNQNEPFPGNGKKSSNNAIWGHFIKYVNLSGIGGGKGCNVNQFGDCVAVLTQ